jgi:hypothetical protein
MLKTIISCLALVLVCTAANTTVYAQKVTETGVDVERDVDLLRRDMRTEKKKIIAANLPLTADEATKFWPVYDQYIADITKNYDEFYSAVKGFAAIQKTVTDAQASDFMKRWADLLVKVAQTRQRYIPIVEKVIPAKKAAVFFQMDRRLYSLLELQVVSEMPLLAQ